MKTVRRSLALLLAVMTLCSLLVMPASAASTTAYDCLSDSKYAKTYAVNTGTIIPYTSTDLSQRGTVSYGRSSSSYIDGYNDLLYVMDAGTNSSGQAWAKVSYPVGNNKRVIAYVKLADITANTHSVKSVSSGKFLCSLRQNGSLSSSYYVAKGDTVWLLAVSGSRAQILYPAGSAYRIAWCNKSDYEKYCGSIDHSTAGLTDVTAYFAGKTITIRSVQNGKYLCADSNASGSPLRANRDSASGWETFTVSSNLTADGWAGFKAHNGKYLSADYGASNAPVKANAPRLLLWECVRIYRDQWGNYFIKAQVNGKFYSARTDVSNIPVRACAAEASAWERFTITVIGEPEPSFSPVWPCQSSNTISTMYRYWNNGSPKNHGVRSNMYNAFDVSGSSGDPILAMESGTVVEKGNQGSKSFGHYVVIEHSNGLRSLYGHLKQEASVSVGDSVTRGQQIGQLGSTGNSTGPHLHFEVYDPNDHGRVINPWVSYYQGKVAVTVGGNSYKANSRYPSDATAKAWCDWLTNSCTKSGSNYVFKP